MTAADLLRFICCLERASDLSPLFDLPERSLSPDWDTPSLLSAMIAYFV